MNLASVKGAFVDRVQAIAFRQPMFQGSTVARLDGSDGAIASAKLRGRAATVTGVMDSFVVLFRGHRSMKIGQVKKGAGGPDCRSIGGVEAEEIDSGLAAVGHVGAYIQFWKARQSRQRRKAASANAAHAEGHDSDPARSVEGVERQWRRHQGTHYG